MQGDRVPVARGRVPGGVRVKRVWITKARRAAKIAKHEEREGAAGQDSALATVPSCSSCFAIFAALRAFVIQTPFAPPPAKGSGPGRSKDSSQE